MCEREGVWTTSEKLCVPQKALYTWQHQARLEHGEAPTGLRPGETIEQGFKRQGRELEKLREANYIVTKSLEATALSPTSRGNETILPVMTPKAS